MLLIYEHLGQVLDLTLGTEEEEGFNPLILYITLSSPIRTGVPYANSLDPDETPSNSASHLDPSCLTLRQHSE